jgi:hypothetical protein
MALNHKVIALVVNQSEQAEKLKELQKQYDEKRKVP